MPRDHVGMKQCLVEKSGDLNRPPPKKTRRKGKKRRNKGQKLFRQHPGRHKLGKNKKKKTRKNIIRKGPDYCGGG